MLDLDDPTTQRTLKEWAAMAEIIIRREKDGREYGIDSADFRRGKHFLNEKGEYQTFEAAGFEIVSLADGSAYEAPAARHAPSAPSHGEHSG